MSFKINNPKLNLIQEALDDNSKLKIKYYSFNRNELTEREVKPLRIEMTVNKLFLVGKCLLRGEERSFNLDRILALEILRDA